MPIIKALSVYQPHASLIALLEKEYETRPNVYRYRGLLAIHAARHWTTVEQQLTQEFIARFNLPQLRNPPLGAVLCVVNLRACYMAEAVYPHISAKERAFGNFKEGRSALKLEMVKVFEPFIPARGQQGLWDWDCPVAI